MAAERQWSIRRKKPYTVAAFARLRCIRCGKPAVHQWQICSDGNNYRPICGGCDVALNAPVLRWMKHPNADALLSNYKQTVITT